MHQQFLAFTIFKKEPLQELCKRIHQKRLTIQESGNQLHMWRSIRPCGLAPIHMWSPDRPYTPINMEVLPPLYTSQESDKYKEGAMPVVHIKEKKKKTRKRKE